MSVLTQEQLEHHVAALRAEGPGRWSATDLVDTYEARVAELESTSQIRATASRVDYDAMQQELGTTREECRQLTAKLITLRLEVSRYQNSWDEAMTACAHLASERDTLRTTCLDLRAKINLAEALLAETTDDATILRTELRLAELARDLYRTTLGRLVNERKALAAAELSECRHSKPCWCQTLLRGV
jgi:chromosome segregation ATPase